MNLNTSSVSASKTLRDGIADVGKSIYTSEVLQAVPLLLR